MKLLSDNNNDRQSSGYFLDLRNSTFITRQLSLDDDKKTTISTERLKIHANHLMQINEFVKRRLSNLNPDTYYYNDTGDGHLCLFWDELHAWTALNISCSLAIYLSKHLKEYQNTHLENWSIEIGEKLNIGFGIGLHTGGSLVYFNELLERKFVFGIVLNTAARVESYTKQFHEIKLLLTQNFKDYLENQIVYATEDLKYSFLQNMPMIKPVTNYNVDVKDSKKSGHLLYTIDNENWQCFNFD